ncbi:tyrosine-type recombinase/integrase [Paraburkholderia sp. BL25I1N1]|uniref:tyrosine-type recombinase/integrase n=1 Tax=Paraburkholderia sp. BL25I1N1 TaxID=1938804 RepID=UPI0021590EED|nr:tyrosine-type recombinase/integrase [Paraburkholderia sp. BL25I1N1]
MLEAVASVQVVACRSGRTIARLLRSQHTCRKRDYAILLLLVRLGLRGGEVLAMTLDDLDLERGEVVVRGKGQRLGRLPLLAQAGAALASCLCDVCPACPTRRVFVRMKTPREELAGPIAICSIVRRALRRAGLDPQFKGAHLLRHSLANNLLRSGATLREIGQLLRHRKLRLQLQATTWTSADDRRTPPTGSGTATAFSRMTFNSPK